jgi:predicted metal-dependent hydrolase
MPTVTVGDVAIPYTVRRSARARRLRLVVTPGQVELVAPASAREARIRAFVDSRRHWIRDKTEALRSRSLEPIPPRFIDGAKVLFRGRHLSLRVEPGDGAGATLQHASAQRVRVPRELSAAARERQARDLVISWLNERALADARSFVDLYAPRLGARPAALRIGNQKTLWGSCSPRDVISLNWRLVTAPPPVYEYVVVHELCHLRERNHSARFWRLVAELMPDYRERRAWLKEHGVGLG